MIRFDWRLYLGQSLIEGLTSRVEQRFSPVTSACLELSLGLVTVIIGVLLMALATAIASS
jgi:hypothetical protein